MPWPTCRPIPRVLIVSDAWLPAGERRGAHAGDPGGRAGGAGHRGRGDRPGPLPHPALPDLPGHPPLGAAAPQAGAADRPPSHRTRCTSPPRVRSASPRAQLAKRCGWTFTTAFHTRFPEYLRARTRVPTRLSYAWLRRFHAAGHGLMVATESLRQDLAARGFRTCAPGRAAWTSRAVPAGAARRLAWACRARSASMSAASRSRRTSAPSSISICPARRSSSATARSWPRSSATTRACISPA